MKEKKEKQKEKHLQGSVPRGLCYPYVNPSISLGFNKELGWI